MWISSLLDDFTTQISKGAGDIQTKFFGRGTEYLHTDEILDDKWSKFIETVVESPPLRQMCGVLGEILPSVSWMSDEHNVASLG